MKNTSSAGCRLLHALMATTVVGAIVTPAMALANQTRHRVEIGAGPLAPALKKLAAQTGLQIMYDEEAVSGRSTRGVRGEMSADQALGQLLDQTGVAGRFAGGRQVVLGMTTGATGDEAASTGEAVELDEIVIYGSRETARLGESASSVGVVPAKAIEDGQIRDVQQSFRRLGNVMDSAFTNSGFIIRGLGSEGFTPAGAPMGSVYVDGVLQTRYGARFGSRGLWDTEQVKVYRGPQSTLSGRAATAGAIYIKTKDPTFERGIELSGTVGNREMRGSAFVVNTPIVDEQIALRISGSYLSQRTDVNYPRYEHYNNYDDFVTDLSGSLRAKLLLTPTEMPDTKALISYSYSKDRPNERLVFRNDGAGFDLDDRRGDSYNFGGFLFDTFAEFRGIEVHNAGLEVTHDFSNALTFTAQTGLTYGTTTRQSIDADEGLPQGIRGAVDDSLLTQEFRLNYDQDRWKWVVGVFGSHQKFDSDLNLNYGLVPPSHETFVRTTSNLALFGEATYEFAPTWFLTAGGRLDYLEEETNIATDSIPEDPAAIDEFNFVPKVSLAKDLNESHRIGATYSEGFRTGGYFVDRRDPAGQTLGYYDPEYARNYELFYKGKMLDDRLTLNANLFFTQYTDQQVEITPDASRPGTTITENAGSSRSWGFEIEPNFEVNEQLSLFTSIGYINTKFEDFETASTGVLNGLSFPDAPEWSVALGGRYTFLSGFYVGGDAKYTSAYNSRFGEGSGADAMEELDERIIVNAQAGFKKDNWEINAFAENLLDEKYLTFADRDTAVPGIGYGQAGARRSFGVNIKASVRDQRLWHRIEGVI